MALMRIQKILSSAGICSRRKAEFYLTNGFVKVNGSIVKVLGSKADPNVDKICLFGNKLTLAKNNIYIVLNKPLGYVSSCSQGSEKLVVDLIDLPNRLFPVGRLDKNSTGLIIMTNDGRIHHKISHPSFRHEKEYYVETLNSISNDSISTMRKGILLDGKITSKAKVVRISNNKFKITLIEGRNRQIRRMVNQLKNEILVLKRIRVENIKLGSLQEGCWRYFYQREIKDLICSLKI